MYRLISMCPVILILTSCALLRPTPGKEKEAEPGFKASKPVIEALEKFRRVHAEYPSKLGDLIPDYINKVDSQLAYQPDTKSYSLGFTYMGWGISYCEYRPEADWNCKTKY